MDGNTAAAYIGYNMSDLAIIYPITPATDMGEHADRWAAEGELNIYDNVLGVTEMQSEGGAVGALHGALTSGSLGVTFTSSQGLLLMIPNMYKIAGGLMPAVFHVASRVVGSFGLSIFCDHGDVMATRQTGFAHISSSTVQEVMDLGFIAHLSAIKCSIPFMNFFDGFRVSHEINSIEPISKELMKKMVDLESIKKFREGSLNPEHPHLRGTVQSSEVYFQHCEATNLLYEKCPDIVQDYFDQLAKETGRQYHLFDYIGHPKAKYVIVALGSGANPVEEYIESNPEEKIGLIKVRLFRPFSSKHLKESLPSSVKRIAVLDRCKEPGSSGEPLFLDVCASLAGTKVEIYNGRYAICGKEFTPAMAKGVFENIKKLQPKNNFTIGIIDDLTKTDISFGENIDTVPLGTRQCLFWGMGSDGTVGANKSAIKLISENTPFYGQGHFVYSAHKSGGVTISHLRFAPTPIKSAYSITDSDYLAVSVQSYLGKYDLFKTAKEGSTFVLNTEWTNLNDLNKNIPGSVKREIAKKKLKFFVIDATKIAEEVGLGGRVNMIMQSVFFKLANVLPVEEAIKLLKKSIEKEYGSKGESVVKSNELGVDTAIKSIISIDYPIKEWENAEIEEPEYHPNDPPFIRDIMRPLLKLEGDEIKCSTLCNLGRMPPGTSKYEKRGFSSKVPHWHEDKCIQCNICAFSCPHAVIRPFLVTSEEVKKAPGKEYITIPAENSEYQYRIQVSTYDCTGCEVCVNACPASALSMVTAGPEREKEKENWEYSINLPMRDNVYKVDTVKGSQFRQPLFEFSGACAGCGETPIIKLATQLYGDQMFIANASGCSSVYGGTYPWNPYTINSEGYGPCWSNSLFEDNAEFGLGMALSVNNNRLKLKKLVEKEIKGDTSAAELILLYKEWIKEYNSLEKSKELSLKIKELINKEKSSEIYSLRDMFAKKVIWIQGGDGWAYDIGFGGLDHVLASGADINILVLDTEVYSNTGGQASKSTPRSGVAKFAASGKSSPKKDLGAMAMTYGNVYVANICTLADPRQAVKAVKEAVEYPGVSIIIAYTPCIAHGIKGGLGKAKEHVEDAIKSGYVLLYRYNPSLLGTGKEFSLDSKKPKQDIENFISNEGRFNSLKTTFPEQAKVKQVQLAQDIELRYNFYKAIEQKYKKKKI